MVGQGPAVLAVDAGQVGVFLFVFFISSILASFSNASSLERRLDILKYCGLGCTQGSCQLLLEACSLSTG